MVDYGERLSKAMKDAGITTAKLAEKMGLSYQAVRKVETGRSKAFNAANNARAASILGVSADQLALGRGAEPAQGNLVSEPGPASPYVANVVDPFRSKASIGTVQQAAMLVWESSRHHQPARLEAVLGLFKELLHNRSDAEAASETADHIAQLLDNSQRGSNWKQAGNA